MCIAVSGTVLEINGNTALVDFSGNIIEARAGLVKVNIGDKVLVHAGCILQVISKFDDKMLLDLMSEISQASEE